MELGGIELPKQIRYHQEKESTYLLGQSNMPYDINEEITEEVTF